MKPEAPNCPPTEVLARLADGTLAEDEKAATLDHLLECEDCALEMRAVLPLEDWARESAVLLESDVPSPARPLPDPGPAANDETPGPFPFRSVLQWAAGILLALGLGLWWSEPGPPAGPATGPDVVRSGDLPQPDDDGSAVALPTPPETLEAPGAAPPGANHRYRFELVDADLAPAWTSEWSSESSVELPSEVRQRMGPGTTWLWRVTTDDGRDLEEGPWREIVLAP